jgi:hypothetical protein
MNDLRTAAQQALEALENCTSEHGHRCNRCDSEVDEGGRVVTALRAALAQQEQEPVAYTGDVARRMREAEMTFHLGMPHAVVMQQMTRFHDLVCAEASLRAAAAFAIPHRREWRGLRDEEIRRMGIETPGQQGGWNLAFARAIEAALKEKNNG